VLQERAAIEDCLDSLDQVPLAGEFLDLPLLRRVLADLAVKVTPETTARAGHMLLRGLSVGLFLRNLTQED
jgi:hypothetical protein